MLRDFVKMEVMFISKGSAKNCKLGLHIPREMCINYAIGFCPEGPNCAYAHVKSFILPQEDNLFFLKKIKDDVPSNDVEGKSTDGKNNNNTNNNQDNFRSIHLFK